MAVDVAALRDYLGDGGQAKEESLAAVLAQAVDLVTMYVGSKEVPQVILDGAILETGSKLYQKRYTQAGTYGDATGVTVMAPRDPMITSYPLLDPYVGIVL